MAVVGNATATSEYSSRSWLGIEIFSQTYFTQLSIGAFFIRRVGEEAMKPFSKTQAGRCFAICRQPRLLSRADTVRRFGGSDEENHLPSSPQRLIWRACRPEMPVVAVRCQPHLVMKNYVAGHSAVLLAGDYVPNKRPCAMAGRVDSNEPNSPVRPVGDAISWMGDCPGSRSLSGCFLGF